MSIISIITPPTLSKLQTMILSLLSGLLITKFIILSCIRVFNEISIIIFFDLSTLEVLYANIRKQIQDIFDINDRSIVR